eukprot:s2331_g5.t1
MKDPYSWRSPKNRAKAGAMSFFSATWQGLWPCQQHHDMAGTVLMETTELGSLKQLHCFSCRNRPTAFKLLKRGHCTRKAPLALSEVHVVSKLARQLLSYTKQTPISCLQFESRNIPLLL